MRRVLWTLLLLGGCVDEELRERADAIAALEGDATAGAVVYADECETCHGADGEGVADARFPEHLGHHDDADLALTILRGPWSMPSFEDLPDPDIADVIAHLRASFEAE